MKMELKKKGTWKIENNGGVQGLLRSWNFNTDKVSRIPKSTWWWKIEENG